MWKFQPFFPEKKCENLFFFTKNFPQYLPLETWIAVSTNLLPKVCHQETWNDFEKKYQKDEMSSKSTSGHVESSFENPSRNFSPKRVDFLAQIPRSVLNYIGFKKTTFPQTFLWTRKLHFSEPCHIFFHYAEKRYPKMRGRFLYCFPSNRLSFLKISSGQLICFFESFADEF